MRIVPDALPVRIGSELTRKVQGDSWSGPSVLRTGSEDGDPSQLGRIANHVQTVLGTGVVNGSGAVVASADRILTKTQLRLIYQRTPDVRSCIDGIVRRIATQDWDIVPNVDPEHDLYDALLDEAVRIRDWFLTPTADLDLFQEVFTATLTDLLVWDAGVQEAVTDTDPVLITELVSVRGADIHPVVNVNGRLEGYVQDMDSGVFTSPGSVRTFTPDQIVYYRLFPNNEGPEGLPILESLVYEIAGILRSAEFVSSSLNLNEVSPGLLVISGIAREAKKRLQADFESKAAQDWKMRILSADSGSVDARWIEFRKAPREMQVQELQREIKRTIWRTFGVMPVEQGDTGDMPRATATVQLDVGTSHLLTPIMDLIEGKINARIVPRRIQDQRLKGLLSFRFKRERELTPAEQAARATAFTTYVREGILSRNEVRKLIHFAPAIEGDVLTVSGPGGLPIPLIQIVGGSPDEVGGLDGSVDTAESETEAEDTETETSPAPEAKGKRLRLGLLARSQRPALGAREHGRRMPRLLSLALHSRSEDDLPSEWQKPGKFDDVRTLDLPSLWEEVSGYTRDVNPIWEEARTAALSSVSAHYVEDGFGLARRQALASLLSAEVDKLHAQWALTVGERYDHVALQARKRVGEWTAFSSSEKTTRARADIFRRQAMSYLLDTGGLLSDVRTRMARVLIAVTDDRDHPSPLPDLRVPMEDRAMGLGPDATTAEVLAVVGAIWDAAKHRIKNWAGALLDLAYSTMETELAEGAASGAAGGIEDPIPGDSVEWWYEWVTVGDEHTCQTCVAEGSRGFQPLNTLRIRPGNGTECRMNCRCVLVVWTKAEVDGGRAQKFGA